MTLILAISGTLNGARAAYSELKASGQKLFGEQFDFALFQIDTHKNFLDYIELLQIAPNSVTRMPVDSHGSQSWLVRLRHLIYPLFYAVAWITSIRAVWHLFSDSHGFFLFGLVCLGVQTLYSIRPMYRFMKRAFGAEQNDPVYQ